MLLIAIRIQPRFSCTYGYIRYVGDSNSFDTIQVQCFKSELKLLLLKNDEIIKEIKIKSPKDIFIPTSILFESDYVSSIVNSDSTIKYQTKLTPAGHRFAEFSFRVKVYNEIYKRDTELKSDIKHCFKECFKNRVLLRLLCGCGVGLPEKPVCSDADFFEGWTRHVDDPPPIPQPSSRILYADETSFHLNPRPNADISCKSSATLDKKCCYSQNADCTTDLSSDCPNVSSNIDCSNKSSGVKNKSELNAQVLNSSDHPNVDSSSLKQADSSVKSCTHHGFDDYKCSDDDKNEYLYDLKAVNVCESCRDSLTAETSSIPFMGLYFNKLILIDASKNHDHLEYARQITLLSFWTLVKINKSAPLPAYICLQSKVPGESRCLLVNVLRSTMGQFLLEDSIENIPAEIDMKMEPVHQIMYYLGTPSSEYVREWRQRSNVEHFRVSDTMVKTLTEILQASSKYCAQMPEGGDFCFGYMRTPCNEFERI
ncbi:hypothetical protein HNY73_013291 [Argiope bruennichi]|uniref:Uncharacterized protein n=1 Tax=Argiope bruennichi TaxID=94029 RepID=A0A8T0EYD1_ARGBR|nr:hypothetical protein HNY73_013291 [Argiope bruennichi]